MNRASRSRWRPKPPLLPEPLKLLSGLGPRLLVRLVAHEGGCDLLILHLVRLQKAVRFSQVIIFGIVRLSGHRRHGRRLRLFHSELLGFFAFEDILVLLPLALDDSRALERIGGVVLRQVGSAEGEDDPVDL